MLKIYQKYIAQIYIKYLFIIFIALESFYVGIDVLTNLKDIPKSANLFLLYIVFDAMSAVNYALPLSLVFALIASKFAMIRSNELIAMYSSTISKNKIILPPFFIALLITFCYIIFNFTNFVYSYEYKKNILDFSQIGSSSSDLFLKFEGKYVYFNKLDPIKKEASNIKIFTTKNNELTQIISAKKAIFKDNIWHLKEVKITTKPLIIPNKEVNLSITHKPTLKALEGFKPQIIENVHQANVILSIPDSLQAISFFYSQGVSLNSIKSNLYTLLFFPFFSPFMLLILYYYMPASTRFFNLTLLSFLFIFITLSIWGILFSLTKLASSTINAETAIILPILLMLFYSLWLYKKNKIQ